MPNSQLANTVRHCTQGQCQQIIVVAVMEQPQAVPGLTPSNVFAPPPEDSALAERIKLFAKYAATNGAAFVETVISHHGESEEYAFLRPGGDAHPFYCWALYCHMHSRPLDQPLAQGQARPAVAAPAPALAAPAPAPSAAGLRPERAQQYHQQLIAALPPEVSSGFGQVMAGLTGSKVRRSSGSSAGFGRAEPGAWRAMQQPVHAATGHALLLVRKFSLPDSLQFSCFPWPLSSPLQRTRSRPARPGSWPVRTTPPAWQR